MGEYFLEDILSKETPVLNIGAYNLLLPADQGPYFLQHNSTATPRTIEKAVTILSTFEAGTKKGNNDNIQPNNQNGQADISTFHLANEQSSDLDTSYYDNNQEYKDDNNAEDFPASGNMGNTEHGNEDDNNKITSNDNSEV